MTDIDIRETANRVQALFAQNRTREAVQLLEQERRDEPRAVQEALDRYVAKGAETQLTALQRTGALNAEDTALLSPSLQRLQAATAMPRFPAENETETAVERNLRHGNSPRPTVEPATLTDAQQYDVYASIVMTRGSDASRRELDNGQQRVILGLRQENNTLDGMDNPRTPVDESQSGKGVYDDRLVVLWKDANGMGHVVVANRANTEPTAQYDHNAGSDGRRQLGESGIETRVINPSLGFENVTGRRKIEGEDVNNDRMRDMGRLGQGTVEMIAATHANPAASGTQFALRPSPDAVTAGQGQVQRDTNGDGWFTQADINGVQNLNNTFKIHSGSRNNTDSAGCQTIHPSEYSGFMTAVQGLGNAQTSWQYVLTATTPGMFRNINLEQAPNIDRQQGQQVPIPNGPERVNPQGRPDAPRNGPPGQDLRDGQGPNQQRPNQLDPQERPGQAPPVPRRGAGGQAALGSDDLNPQDKEQHEKIRIAVQKLGFDGEPAANISAALLLATKEHGGIRRIDDIRLNEPGKINAEGTLVIAAYRPYGADKAPFFNARVEHAEASQIPAEKTFQNIQNFNQQQSQQQALAQQKAQEKQQNSDSQGQSPQLPGGPAKPGGPSMA
jgi:hypothetical protein